jgi:hypothetical protein
MRSPQWLMIDNQNPLKLLHAAMSQGVHSNTDAACLDATQHVRVVLAELADLIRRVLKDDAELKAAISKLHQHQSRKKAAEPS